jgi:uncharacterized membrane-anchored protein
MGWHGVTLAVGLFSAAVMTAILIVVVILVILGVVDVLSGPKRGGTYRKHGLPWRRRYRAVPARDHDGRGMLTVREEQLWKGLTVRYDTDVAADPWQRGGA